MLYHLFLLFSRYMSIFGDLSSVIVRSGAAFATSFVLSLIGGFYFLSFSKHFLWFSAREYTPSEHKKKEATPSMGGVFILFSVLVSVLLWADIADKQVFIFMLMILLFGTIGLWDDWLKMHHKKGVKALYKFVAQIVAATSISILLVYWHGLKPVVSIPFFKSDGFFLGPLFIIWTAFILVACSNAVNLTDGLDGLAASCLIPNYLLLTVLAVMGHGLLALFSGSASEIAPLGASLIGALLGFLWYNSYPAQVFMGDVGSLTLGAALAYLALVSKYELLLVIAAGLFVAETLSVMIQVFSYRLFKKRIFTMAPLHHHFELNGIPEPKITARCTIISWLLVLCASVIVYFW